MRGRRYYMDWQAFEKFETAVVFQDIQNSFQWPTGIGPEPHQNFFGKKIPTNAVARAIQSFGQNGLWLANLLTKGKMVFVN